MWLKNYAERERERERERKRETERGTYGPSKLIKADRFLLNHPILGLIRIQLVIFQSYNFGFSKSLQKQNGFGVIEYVWSFVVEPINPQPSFTHPPLQGAPTTRKIRVALGAFLWPPSESTTAPPATRAGSVLMFHQFDCCDPKP